MNGKRVIKGIAKTAGKYTLKGLGKGLELTGRGAVRTLDAIMKNPELQKIATGAGLLAASVMIPTVAVGLMSTIAVKHTIDKAMGSDKGLLDEINDVLKVGRHVTRGIDEAVLHPLLKGLDNGIKNVGQKYQDAVDRI